MFERSKHVIDNTVPEEHATASSTREAEMSDVWQFIGSNLELTFVATLAVTAGVITWIVMHRRHFCSYCGHYTLKHETDRQSLERCNHVRFVVPVRMATYCVNPNCTRVPQRRIIYEEPTREELLELG